MEATTAYWNLDVALYVQLKPAISKLAIALPLNPQSSWGSDVEPPGDEL